MKNLIATTLAATILSTGAAFAAPAAQLSHTALVLFPALAQAELTTTEVHQINSIVNTEDSRNAKRNAIRSLVQ